MKYIIIGYTSDIDIESNTAKINYLTARYLSPGNAHIDWTDDLNKAYSFSYREDAEDCILEFGLENCIIYRIEV